MLLIFSGCVTSAEEVLIQEQSYERLSDVLKDKDSHIIVTLSPQTVASIADTVNFSLFDTFQVISTALKHLGIQYVFDACAGGDVSLVESGHEFLQR